MTQRIYIIFFISALLLFNCKKYPEGGYEKQAQKNILGNWKLTLYEVNGIDSTEFINYNGSETYKKCSFLKHHKKDAEIIIQTEGDGTSIATFSNKNKILTFYSESSNSTNCFEANCNKDYFIPEGNYSQAWQINKLTKTELKLSVKLQKSYVLKFLKN